MRFISEKIQREIQRENPGYFSKKKDGAKTPSFFAFIFFGLPFRVLLSSGLFLEGGNAADRSEEGKSDEQ